MKFLIVFIIFYSSFCYPFQKQNNQLNTDMNNAREVNMKSPQVLVSKFNILPKNKREIPPFDFKVFIQDKELFEKFVSGNLGILEVESPQQIEDILRRGTEQLFFKSYFENTPLLSDFIFRSLKQPESIAKFFSLFLQFNKLIIFSGLLICSFIFSHLLGEYKFNFDILSVQRILFGVFRIGFINGFRIGLFSILFSEHLGPIWNNYTQSVLAFSDQYPILGTIIQIIS
jgi:hypothetical protein